MKLKLLGVSGSLRANSHGLQALSILLDAAGELGADTRLLDLRTSGLPMYNPDAEPEEHVARVLADVAWAEAFVLATPDYHGAMSGAMKNFLDYHWSEFSGKLFGFLCASHEKGITAMEGMRLAVRQCYGWSLPYGVAIHGQHDIDAGGKITNPRLQSRLRMAARDMVVYGSLLYRQFNEDLARNTPDTFAAKYA
ncbi:MAG: NAD(P)H-dependent oxidoreductase [Tepidisphaeraceae bacterium]